MDVTKRLSRLHTIISHTDIYFSVSLLDVLICCFYQHILIVKNYSFHCNISYVYIKYSSHIYAFLYFSLLLIAPFLFLLPCKKITFLNIGFFLWEKCNICEFGSLGFNMTICGSIHFLANVPISFFVFG